MQPFEGSLKLHKLFLKIPARNCPLPAELKLRDNTENHTVHAKETVTFIHDEALKTYGQCFGYHHPKHLFIPKWQPINYSFVCMLISP